MINVKLSENPEDPTYLELISLPVVENVQEVQIRLVKTFGEDPVVQEEDQVGIIYIHCCPTYDVCVGGHYGKDKMNLHRQQPFLLSLDVKISSFKTLEER